MKFHTDMLAILSTELHVCAPNYRCERQKMHVLCVRVVVDIGQGKCLDLAGKLPCQPCKIF